MTFWVISFEEVVSMFFMKVEERKGVFKVRLRTNIHVLFYISPTSLHLDLQFSCSDIQKVNGNNGSFGL